MSRSLFFLARAAIVGVWLALICFGLFFLCYSAFMGEDTDVAAEPAGNLHLLKEVAHAAGIQLGPNALYRNKGDGTFVDVFTRRA